MKRIMLSIPTALLVTIVAVGIGHALQMTIMQFVSHLIPRQKGSLNNSRWIAIFEIPHLKEKYQEIIQCYHIFGYIVGYVVPDIRNSYKRGQNKRKVFRLFGMLIGNEHLIGFWVHPGEHNRHCGGFQLKYSVNGSVMNGLWLGFGDDTQVVQSGSWRWMRDCVEPRAAPCSVGALLRLKGDRYSQRCIWHIHHILRRLSYLLSFCKVSKKGCA